MTWVGRIAKVRMNDGFDDIPDVIARIELLFMQLRSLCSPVPSRTQAAIDQIFFELKKFQVCSAVKTGLRIVSAISSGPPVYQRTLRDWTARNDNYHQAQVALLMGKPFKNQIVGCFKDLSWQNVFLGVKEVSDIPVYQVRHEVSPSLTVRSLERLHCEMKLYLYLKFHVNARRLRNSQEVWANNLRFHISSQL